MATPDVVCNDYDEPDRDACVLRIVVSHDYDAPPGDTTAPTVTQVSTGPQQTDSVVTIDVTDAGTIRRTMVAIKNGPSFELAFDGDLFLYPFASSTREPITNGWRYHFRRSAGWRAGSLTFKIVAIDTGGNEAV